MRFFLFSFFLLLLFSPTTSSRSSTRTRTHIGSTSASKNSYFVRVGGHLDNYSMEGGLGCGGYSAGCHKHLPIGNSGTNFESAPNATIRQCKATCNTAGACGGFEYDRGTTRCSFRSTTACNRVATETKDCYTKPMARGGTVRVPRKVPTIVFVLYHKTGHDLTRTLVHTLASTYGVHEGTREMLRGIKKRLPFNCHNTVALEKATIHIMIAPVWIDCVANSTFDPTTKVVHFVRDAYSMTVSSYMYHRQLPSPEGWSRDLYNSSGICQPRPWTLRMAASMGIDLDPIRRECITIFRTLAPGKSYYEKIRSPNTTMGVKLEAMRFILSGHRAAGADIITMPFNQRWLRRSTLDTMELFMDEWKSNMAAEFSRLVHFIFGNDVMVDQTQLQQLAFHPSGNHVTHASLAQKEQWTKTLSQDAAVALVLNKVLRDGVPDFNADTTTTSTTSTTSTSATQEPDATSTTTT